MISRILAEFSQKKTGEEGFSLKSSLGLQVSLSLEELEELIDLSLELKKA